MEKLILAVLGIGVAFYVVADGKSSQIRVLSREEAEEREAESKKRTECRQKAEYYQQHWRSFRRDFPAIIRSDAERDYQMSKISKAERNERFKQADEIYKKDVEKYNRSIDAVKAECKEFVGKIDFSHVGGK